MRAIPSVLALLVCAFSVLNAKYVRKNENFVKIIVKREGSSTSDFKHVVAAAGSDLTTASKGTSSVTSSVFNLGKTILGAGVLSLPYGVASVTDTFEGLYPATFLLLGMGLISAYSFASIGKACEKHNAKSFAEAWSKSVDPKSSSFLSLTILIKTFFASLIFSIIIGDSFSQILSSYGVPKLYSHKCPVILGITSFILLPLCLLKQLDALKYTSALGLGGILYNALFMTIRYFDKSYAPGGKFAVDIAANLRPSFNVRNSPMLNPMIFMLTSMLSTAYVAHYNAPKFWTELKEPTLPKYKFVVSAAFGLAIAVYTLMTWVGFLTFGGNASGLILNNYSSKDQLATIARIAIGLGIICTYPLTFTALRDSLFDLAGSNDSIRDKLFVPLTVVVLAGITFVALNVNNVGKVVSFSGALIGSLMIYIFPALLNIGNYHYDRKSRPVATSGEKIELVGNYLMAALGVVLAVIGVGMNLRPGNGGAAH